jgi:hypothetical protein
MRRLTAVVGILFMLVVIIVRPAGAANLNFHLAGVEIFPGTTTKDCGGGTYVTTGITFAGTAFGNGLGTWVVSLNVTGELDGTCEPVRCDSGSPVSIVEGTWLLKTLLGAVGGSITGGSLDFRPDGPVVGSCLGPVPGTILVDVDLAQGRFRAVHNAEMSDAFLDHRSFPPRVSADLALTP